ncbi:hypothetical protein EMGBD2_01400 [Nitrospirota bacterium]|nr:hypothetical protein EMGBD2_01400 [Nitrospirota bacterium]GDX89935.1 hypothetical protein LBMAG45_17910 [Nitrospirota bacterium]
MYQEEKSFTLQFSLEAIFPNDYEGEEENQVWVREWETKIKADLLKVVFESLRQHPSWKTHVRNRGKSSSDEIEIVLARDFSQEIPKPQGFTLP